MSEEIIPEHIDDPFRFADQNLGLAGVVRIKDLSRLNLNYTEGNIYATLKFGVDEQGIHFLKGHLSTKLVLQCQRCMEPYQYEIISDFALGIVTTLDEADALPELYEPVLTKANRLALRDLIEDEIILNLPIIPKHDPKVCKLKLPSAQPIWESGKEENPFHILKSLKDKQK